MYKSHTTNGIFGHNTQIDYSIANSLVFFVNNTKLTILTYLSILCFSLQEIIRCVGDT